MAQIRQIVVLMLGIALATPASAQVFLHNDKVVGSGTVVDIHGLPYILTANHLCRTSEKMSFTLFLPTGRMNGEAIRVRHHLTRDLCLLRPTTDVPFYIRLGDKVEDGDHLLTYVKAPAKNPKFTFSLKFEKSIFDPVMLSVVSLFAGYAYPGCSGSPVLDKAGQIVGILSAGEEETMDGPFFTQIVVEPLEAIRDMINGIDSINY